MAEIELDLGGPPKLGYISLIFQTFICSEMHWIQFQVNLDP